VSATWRYRPARRNRRRRVHPVSLVLALVGVYWACAALWRVLAAHAALSIAGVVLALAATGMVFAARWQVRRRREELRIHRAQSLADFLRMDDVQFEFALADLCRRDGCTRVTRVGGANDHAADVLATLPGRRWWQFWLPRNRRILIQAKRYGVGNPVRSPALQAVNGTYRDVHRTHLAAVVTTSGFTADAVRFNRLLPEPLRLVDGQGLAAWAAGGRPPWA